MHDVHLILGRLDRIEATLGRIESALTTQGAKTMSILDDVLTEVSAQTTEVASVKALVDGLHQQLSDALAAGDTAKAQQILDALKANDAALQAVLANTPSASQVPAADPAPPQSAAAPEATTQ